jgi:hypothetical protein
MEKTMPAMNYNQVAHYYDIYVQSDFDLQFFQEETQQIAGKVLELMCGHWSRFNTAARNRGRSDLCR